MSSRLRHPLVALAATVLLTLPWVGLWVTGSVESVSTITRVAISGIAVLGASFLLAWGAETAEKDVPRAFALAVLAVLAVAPEYAVDALYAWQAASDPNAANLAVANMTGANRILIGLGWSGIALFSIYKASQLPDSADDVVDKPGTLRDAVQLDPSISTEILFLFAATVFAFFVPLHGGIDWFDTVVLVGLYFAYIGIIVRGDPEEHEEQVGVPAYFQARPKGVRIPAVLTLFAYSGFLIFTAVEPFAHGLEEIGLQFGIPEFFMIQWFAPLASESPELIVTAYLVNKARATAAFNALISSKLNQWTLLIGTLVVVYSIALGRYGMLPFDFKQAAEIWLTAAQSFFALAILMNFEISVREAVALLVLFVSQVVAEFAIIRTVAEPLAETYSIYLLVGYSVVYMILGVALVARRFDDFRRLTRITAATIRGEPTPTDVEAD
ncbi:sodium:calcium antiporter [Halopelagius longus]|uniref:Cation:H+ antiporter n=1 Tax=Halopelagius longus TaxID=1236180 RepID=A0A1H1DBK8_9EURY|nr:sodium:calcium antiporter [Halopelagius longus]RDI71262.1 sodium:calcium antiporter [Halopelagius longus]SDQ73843.1 cation:H+ antiporter [Halopelagius longus]